MRDDLLVLVLHVLGRAVGVEVVEQPAGLVLLDVQPGQPQQPAAVVAGVDDLRLELHGAPVDVGDDIQLGDVEAEVVEAADPLVDAVALAGVEGLRPEQLVPQRRVALDDLVGDLDRVDRSRAAARRPPGRAARRRC